MDLSPKYEVLVRIFLDAGICKYNFYTYLYLYVYTYYKHIFNSCSCQLVARLEKKGTSKFETNRLPKETKKENRCTSYRRK